MCIWFPLLNIICEILHIIPFFFFGHPCLTACGILVPGPEIKLGPSAVGVHGPNHWTTREFPVLILWILNKGPSSQSYGFSSMDVMYVCEIWTEKKVECRRVDAFELWCWRRLLRVPWTARRSSQSILKISPRCSLEGLMLKLKLQYFGYLMRRADSLEKTDAGRDWGQEEKGMTEDEMAGWHH